MTKRLYYTDPSITEWNTSITSVSKQKDFFLISLKETAFYPEGGGQPADLGFIDGVEVDDVFEQDGQVFHKVHQPLELKQVCCSIDSERRLDHTQHHSGQHLLSAVCIELFNAPTLSFHLGTETATIDLDITDLDSVQLIQIENRANQYIVENREIKTFYVNETDLTKLPLRKLPKVTEDIRIVDMERIDVSACCGTHVQKTAEISLIKLLKTEKQRGKIRLHFICGIRALKYFQEIHSLITGLAAKFNTSQKEILGRVENVERELHTLQKEYDALTKENQEFIADRILNEQPASIIEHNLNSSVKELQSMARVLSEKSGKPVLLCNQIEMKMTASIPKQLGLATGKWFKQNLNSFNGKGGGSDLLAQASFQSLSDMTGFSSRLKDFLQSGES